MSKTARSWLSIGLALLFLVGADRLLMIIDFSFLNVFGWLAFALLTIPWVLVTLVPLCLFGTRSRWIYVPFVLLTLPLIALGWFVRVSFDMQLDGDWVGILLGSSPDEIAWFARRYLGWATVLYAGLLVGLAVLFLRILRLARNVRVSRLSVLFAVLVTGVFVLVNHLYPRSLRKFESQPLVHLIADSIRSFRMYADLARMKNAPQLPPGLRLAEAVGEEVGVFVLGESATRSRWGLYGYGRETTPNLSRRKGEVVRFDDLVTASSDTANVLRYLFTTRSIERPDDLRYTLPQALRKAGCDVSLYSNHERWGVCDGDESFDLAGCEPMVFMREIGETNRFDEVLVPHVERALAKAVPHQIVFVHLMGSHAASADRYPPARAPFAPEDLKHSSDYDKPELGQNHYDNSIWYTDAILERLLRLLEKSGRPSWLVYLSDHGETPSARGWRMASDPDLWNVPFVIWLSPEFRARYPHRVKRLEAAARRPLQTDQLFYGLLDFFGVEGLDAPVEANFLTDSFRPRRPRPTGGSRAE